MLSAKRMLTPRQQEHGRSNGTGAAASERWLEGDQSLFSSGFIKVVRACSSRPPAAARRCPDTIRAAQPVS
jgi:hypothetical protein